MKNCGKKFHQQVATKDFMGDLVKIIGPKYDPPTVLQEKVLSSIQVKIIFIDIYINNLVANQYMLQTCS